MASVSKDKEKADIVTPDGTSIREVTPPGGSSDGEGSERTTREKLKKTSIAGLQQQSKSTAGAVTGEHPLAESITVDQIEPPKENGGLRGRPSKKRSFEDLQNDEHTGPTENGSTGLPDFKRSTHKRMRSRDVGHGDQPQPFGKLEEMGSPVQEESDEAAHLSPGGPGVLVDANSQTDTNAQADKTTEEKTTEGNKTEESIASVTTAASVPFINPEPRTEEPSQGQESTSSTFPHSSAFANTSSTSPFGSVKSPVQPPKDAGSDGKDVPPPTSSSAFASSGLSAFASSEKSPFGAAGSAKPTGGFGSGGGGGFGGTTAPGGFGSTSSGFGGTSAFGNKSSSGFGGGSGFGSARGFGGGLTSKPFGTSISSFAGSGTTSTFGKPKPFGAKDDNEDEDGEDGEDADDNAEQDDDTRQDSRFHRQEVETGEEGEEIFFLARARLYHFEKQWKERGTGNIKINIRYEQKALSENKESEGGEEQDTEAGDWSNEIRKARVVMRADGVHRVILNSPVFKGMKVGTIEGEPPVGKTMYLTGLENGQPRVFQVRINKEDVLREFYDKIEELKEELE